LSHLRLIAQEALSVVQELQQQQLFRHMVHILTNLASHHHGEN